MADRIDRSERLLNLVVALLGTRRAISRSQIRESVPGYAAAASDSAFERMFERDKDELRSMGIPIETVMDDSGEVLGYRVDQGQFGYVDVQFSAEEFHLLSIAAKAWEQAALGPQARKAVLKLRPFVAGEEEVDLPPSRLFYSAHLTASDAALLPLMKAVRERVSVRFPYRAAGSPDASNRIVEPWGVVCRSGHWYLLGYDLDRGAPRTFRLSRISGTCTVTSERSREPHPGRDQLGPLLNTMLGSYTERGDSVSARVVVRRPHGAELQRRSSEVTDRGDGTDELLVEGPRAAVLSAVVRALPYLEVLEPPEMFADIEAHLGAVLAAHGETA